MQVEAHVHLYVQKNVDVMHTWMDGWKKGFKDVGRQGQALRHAPGGMSWPRTPWGLNRDAWQWDRGKLGCRSRRSKGYRGLWGWDKDSGRRIGQVLHFDNLLRKCMT